MGTLKQSFLMGGSAVTTSRPKLTPAFFISSILSSAVIIPSVLPKRAKMRVYKLEKLLRHGMFIAR
jgi:hypothetical protein